MQISSFQLVVILILYLCFNMGIDFSKRFRKCSFVTYLIIITLILGTFYENPGLGGDYDNYRNIFIYLNPTNIPSDEYGFHFLNVIIKTYTDNFNIAFFIFMFIINFFILKTIYDNSKNVEFSILIYVMIGGYISAANIIRQFIAASIYFYSVKYLINKKYLIFILGAFIAFTFHTTVAVVVVITVIIYFFTDKLNKYYNIYFIVINSLIIIEPIIRKFGIEVIDKGYTESSFSYGSSIFHYLIQLIFIIFYYINKENITSFKDKLYMNLAMISLGFMLLSNNMVLYARFSSYFNLFNILLMPTTFLSVKNIKENRIYIYIFILVCSGYFLLVTTKGINAYSGNHITDFFKNIFIN